MDVLLIAGAGHRRGGQKCNARAAAASSSRRDLTLFADRAVVALRCSHDLDPIPQRCRTSSPLSSPHCPSSSACAAVRCFSTHVVLPRRKRPCAHRIDEGTDGDRQLAVTAHWRTTAVQIHTVGATSPWAAPRRRQKPEVDRVAVDSPYATTQLSPAVSRLLSPSQMRCPVLARARWSFQAGLTLLCLLAVGQLPGVQSEALTCDSLADPICGSRRCCNSDVQFCVQISYRVAVLWTCTFAVLSGCCGMCKQDRSYVESALQWVPKFMHIPNLIQWITSLAYGTTEDSAELELLQLTYQCLTLRWLLITLPFQVLSLPLRLRCFAPIYNIDISSSWFTWWKWRLDDRP